MVPESAIPKASDSRSKRELNQMKIEQDDLARAPTRMSRKMVRATMTGATLALDSMAIWLSFVLIDRIRGLDWLPVNGSILAPIVVVSYCYFGLITNSFSIYNLSAISRSVVDAIRALILSIIFLIVCAFIGKFSADISRYSLFLAIVSTVGGLVCSRVLIATWLKMSKFRTFVDRLLITDRPSTSLPDSVSMIVIGPTFAGPDLKDPEAVRAISEFAARHDVVYVDCADPVERHRWTTLVRASGIACEVVLRQGELSEAVGIGRFGNADTLILSRGPLSLQSRIKKRAFDLVVATALVILLSPLLLAVALAIRLESKGPAIFTQPRIGQANRPFRIYKFRSMTMAGSDIEGNRSTDRDDERITRVGAFIRRTSIDELPQLFNVIGGSMSLVGPRPHAKGSRAGEQLFWEVSELYWVRHALKPGITGLAQVNGYRGATHRKEDLEARLKYDLEYLQTWSMWNDLVILLATVKVISHANAY